MPTSQLTKSFLFAFSIKSSAALIVFLYHIVLTRNLSLEEMGLYFQYYMYIVFIALFFRLGLDHFIVKDTASFNKISNGFKCFYKNILTIVIALTVFSSLILMLLGLTEFISLVVGGMLLSVLIVNANILKGLNRVNIGLFIQNGAFQFLCCLLFIFLFILNVELSIALVMSVFLCALSLAVILSFKIVGFDSYKSEATQIDVKIDQVKDFIIIAIVAVANQWLAILVLTLFNTEEMVALFGIAFRVVVLYGFIYISISSVLNTRFASIFQKKGRIAVGELYKKTLYGLIPISIVTYFAIVLFGEVFLSIFGSEYANAYLIVCIMSLAQAINIATGPVSPLMVMTGHEKKNKNVALYSLLIQGCLLFLLVPTYGAVGAAIAYCVSVIFGNVNNIYYSQKYVLRVADEK